MKIFNFLNSIFKSKENSKSEYKYYIKIGNASFGYDTANQVALAYMFFQNNCDLDLKIIIRKGKFKEIETTLARITASEESEATKIFNEIKDDDLEQTKIKETKIETDIPGQMEFADLE